MKTRALTLFVSTASPPPVSSGLTALYVEEGTDFLRYLLYVYPIYYDHRHSIHTQSAKRFNFVAELALVRLEAMLAYAYFPVWRAANATSWLCIGVASP